MGVTTTNEESENAKRRTSEDAIQERVFLTYPDIVLKIRNLLNPSPGKGEGAREAMGAIQRTGDILFQIRYSA